MKFHDLVLLLDTHSERYDEVACFARHLDPQDVAACVGIDTECRITGASGSFSFGFAYGNVWRVLRVEEKLGIVVLSSPEPPSDHWLHGESGAGVLLAALQAAAAVPVDDLVPYTIRQEHFALLRKQDDVLHRNLLMEWREVHGAPSSSGKWMVTDYSEHKPFLAWVKKSLWADVPKLDPARNRYDDGPGDVDCAKLEGICATETHPFPGADAHPDKRGGELCVEGTRMPVARILAELADDAPMSDIVGIAENLDQSPGTLRKCLRGLADWLKTQNWTGRKLPAWGEGLTAEDCQRRPHDVVRMVQMLRNELAVHRADAEAAFAQAKADGKTVRAAARNREPLCGANAQALEGALAQVERELAEARKADGAKYRKQECNLSPEQSPVKTAKNVHGFRCRKCGAVFLADGNVHDGIVTCPECKVQWPVERRCGTCTNTRQGDGGIVCVAVHVEVGGRLGNYLVDDDNGPPWSDCRFWKEKP